MSHLENIILSFEHGLFPWTFYKFVSEHPLLDKDSKILFEKIWEEAGDIQLWTQKSLGASCQCCRQFIKENYDLNEKAIDFIVNALSYQWR